MNEDIFLKIDKYLKIHSLFRPFYSGIGSILMLHRIEEKNNSPRIQKNARNDVSPEYLEALISHFLKRNYAVISLDEIHEILIAGRQPKRKFVSFTFDDGYVDAYNHAYPIFKRFSLPFAVYISTSFPDKKALLWWYLLEDMVLKRDHVRFTHRGRDYSFDSSTKDRKDVTFSAIRDLVIKLSTDDLKPLLGDICGSNEMDILQYSGKLTLDWDQIKTMSDDPLVTIGAHTVNHYTLSKLTEKEAQYEIVKSREILERYTGKKIEHFSYPFGSRGEAGKREFDVVRGLGFKTATTTRRGNIFLRHGKYLEALPRIPIRGNREDLSYLEAFTSGYIPALTHAFRRVITE
jgi:peptidoglycan/xylan/chitin deacetylase (PgdA/CDA1 family)